VGSAVVSIDPDLSSGWILRRYLDLPKLLDLLNHRALYMRRADGFADRLEGALFPSLRAALDQAHKEGRAQNNADHFYRRARTGTYVSCWTRGAKDSMAHWQLYGGVSTGLALTTTVDRLVRTALQWKRDAMVHRVKYVDHTRMKNFAIGRYTDVLRFKHEAYVHEREVRVLVPQQGVNWTSNPVNIRLPIPDLDLLIRSVVVAPEADAEFYSSVKHLCAKYGLKAPVRRSKLAFVPV
jgi:hypothetical protein